MELAKRVAGVGEYYFSKKLREIDQMRAEGKSVINLGIGSPDKPPHPSVIEKLSAEAARSNHHAYQPYKGAPILREAFSKWYDQYYGVELDPQTEILPLIGSKEGLMHICMTYIGAGDKVLIPNPGYPTYKSAVTISEGEAVEYKLSRERGWLPDLESIEQAGMQGVKMMIINYPQMPTGAHATKQMFTELIAFAKKHNILIVHDNPYSFIRNDKPMSLLSVEGAKDVAIELNSLSKSHNMSGWRIGMIGGKAEYIDQIIRFKSNMDSGMFYPIQAAAATALSLDKEWYTQLNEVYYSRQELVYSLFDLLGCSYEQNQAGLFVWASLPEGYEGDCYSFTDDILYKCGVFVTPGGIFGSEGNNYVRISLCATKQTIAQAIEDIKKGLGK